jgi:hypothetical protein
MRQKYAFHAFLQTPKSSQVIRKTKKALINSTLHGAKPNLTLAGL